MPFRTKPRGMWANFQTECGCGGVLTVTGGRIDPHTCEEPKPITLADLRAALDNR